MRIYCIIATKNRVELFQEALKSVHVQTKKPNKIIIISDSTDDNYEKEIKLVSKNDIIIKDEYEHNYAGSLNTAINYILKEEYTNESIFNINDIYLAFLDDDDTWRENYLEICEQYLYDFPDFVVAGLFRIDDKNKEGEKLEVFKELSIENFLTSNPHIQGSNTFIKFETLLRAGCFDESMNSTTDRDIFTRVMMLNPKYKMINEILVDINASNTRPRLTNNKEGKKKSLSYFYSKYGGLMNHEQEMKYFERNKLFTDLLPSKEDINNNLAKYISSWKDEIIENELNNRIIFSYIMNDFTLGKRLYENIINYKLDNYKIIIFDNTNKINKLNKNEFTYVFTLDDLKKYTEFIDIMKKMKYKIEGIITDLSISRIILNKFIKENTVDGDIIWILNDSMKLEYVTYENGFYNKNNKLNIKNIISKYYNKADVVIGSYSLDPPVPLLSTIRTSLLDFTYKKYLNKNELYKTDILNYRDYYYALAEKHICLETPLPCDADNIDDIFSGKAYSRYLFTYSNNTNDTYNIGGNIIIYNRKVLDIPYVSPKFLNIISDRSDFLWLKLIQEKNFKLINASFSTTQDKNKIEFNFEKEIDKLIKDILGSSFNKCYGKNQKDKYIEKFKNDIMNKICAIISSFYRIHGLLSICNDKKYIEYFSPSNIVYLINRFKEYIFDYRIEATFKCTKRYIWRLSNIINIQKYLEINKNYKLIGCGSEGFVVRKNNLYKKIYYKELSQKKLDINIKVSKIKSNHLLPIKFTKENGKQVLYYEAEGEFIDYQGGYIRDLINLITILKDNGLVLTNIKSENFKINNGWVVLIDYGKNIENYNQELYESQIKRLFQMFKFYKATSEEFDEIINLSNKNLDIGYNFGMNSLKFLLENKSTENIMDYKIISLIQKYKPKNLIDYGGLKSKIVNSISNYINCSVIDIDIDNINNEELKQKYDSRIRIIENIDEIINNKEKFEIAICCLILDNVNEKLNNKILFNINKLLLKKCHLIISICNPFFDDIKNTQLRTKGYKGEYLNIASYIKGIISDKKIKEKENYHRPFLYYENLFQRNGFKIINVFEINGINIDNLDFISEYLIFDLEKNNYNDMQDCSLLIKICPKEFLISDACINHIVNKLEYGQKFKERLVLVDEQDQNKNNTKSKSDIIYLKTKLDELKKENIIDKIIYYNSTEKFKLYENINTKYVYQTNIDIFFKTRFGDFYKEFTKYKESKTLKGCLNNLNILKEKSEENLSSFIDLEQLENILQLKNTINNEGIFNSIYKEKSLILSNENIGFMHIENNEKNIWNNSVIFNSNIFNPKFNNDKMNFMKNENNFKIPKTEIIVFTTGKNTPIEKIKRMLDSLKKQSYTNFSLIYFDDNSNTKTKEYLYMLSQYDSWCKEHMHLIENIETNGYLKNFDLLINNLILDNNQIIINIDPNDALLIDDAIETIKSYFDMGYDVTIGNLFRVDKPFKKYFLVDFKKSFLKNYDNICLHPKCFRRKLCNYIGDFIKDENNNFIESMIDYAIMIPILESAKKLKFIEKCLYYFEPSNETMDTINEYKNNNIQKIKDYLFLKAKKLFNKPIISVIGEVNVNENDDKIKFFEKLGEALIDNGYRIKIGDSSEIMKAILKGAHKTKNLIKGDLIIISQGNNKNFIDADAIISFGGGAETLNVISIAWIRYKLILAFSEFEGWSKELANKKIDAKIGFKSIDECLKLLEKYIHMYKREFFEIK